MGEQQLPDQVGGLSLAAESRRTRPSVGICFAVAARRAHRRPADADAAIASRIHPTLRWHFRFNVWALGFRLSLDPLALAGWRDKARRRGLWRAARQLSPRGSAKPLIQVRPDLETRCGHVQLGDDGPLCISLFP